MRHSIRALALRLSPPERRYADVLGLSDWPRYPDSGLADPRSPLKERLPKKKKRHNLF